MPEQSKDTPVGRGVADNLDAIKQTMATINPSTKVVAVSKRQPIASILAAIDANHCDFGENYLQEAEEKIAALADDHPQLCWHFIGAIQSNKCRSIAEHFHWVHSVDRKKIADYLNRYSADRAAPLNVCLQVNIDEDTDKSGVNVSEVEALASYVNELPHLRLRGLMTIPQLDASSRAASFEKMRQLYTEIKQKLASPHFDSLSMGMSDDYELAAKHGATMVRIGSKIFGARS